MEKLKAEFYQPAAEFGPLPFWFWNDALDEAEISRQIRDFHAKGVSGWVLHPRIGIPKDIPYLSDRFMSLVKHAVLEAASCGMKVVLYDEGMYPSGSAHGMVVAGNPEFASRGLRVREYPCPGRLAFSPELDAGETVVAVLAVVKSAAHAIEPARTRKLAFEEGRVRFERPTEENWSVLVFSEIFTRGTIRGIHFGEDDGEREAPPAADLLNPAAVSKFIRLTHDRYYEVLREYFGSTVMAMFTDEPDVLGRCAAPDVKPWTGGFLEHFRQCGNDELDLAALWFEAGPDTGLKRKNYRRAVNQRLESAYYRQLSQWCAEHRIALTGHPHESDDIGLLHYFHIPGQDIVWRWVAPEEGRGLEGRHSTVGKCSADAARHRGRRRNANECLGCCGPQGIPWALTMDDMKWYLDWLFVRGVNLIYPHAFYYSLNGAKRREERPPDVGPHNIWWPYYRTLANYIKRLSWLMTDSVNVTPLAVLCEADRLPWAVAKPLYRNQLEFNYLEESLLSSVACRIADGTICIARQQYRVLVIDDAALVTEELRARLHSFMAGGGTVLLYQPAPDATLPEGAVAIATAAELVAAVEKRIVRDLLFRPADPNLRVSHVIKENQHFYLLVNEGETPIRGELRLRTDRLVERWDAWEGEISQPELIQRDRQYLGFPLALQRRESAIIRVDPSRKPERFHCGAAEPSSRATVALQHDWKIETPDGKIRAGRELDSWTRWPGMADFSGTVVYETAFEMTATPRFSKVELDLGQVGEIAQVYLNGMSAGFKLWSPYSLDITNLVKAGANLLRVEVTNSLANRLSGARRDSGLMGPVRIWLIGETVPIRR